MTIEEWAERAWIAELLIDAFPNRKTGIHFSWKRSVTLRLLGHDLVDDRDGSLECGLYTQLGRI